MFNSLVNLSSFEKQNAVYNKVLTEQDGVDYFVNLLPWIGRKLLSIVALKSDGTVVTISNLADYAVTTDVEYNKVLLANNTQSGLYVANANYNFPSELTGTELIVEFTEAVVAVYIFTIGDPLVDSVTISDPMQFTSIGGGDYNFTGQQIYVNIVNQPISIQLNIGGTWTTLKTFSATGTYIETQNQTVPSVALPPPGTYEGRWINSLGEVLATQNLIIPPL